MTEARKNKKWSRWTAKEGMFVRKMRKKGWSIKKIATYLGRTDAGVRVYVERSRAPKKERKELYATVSALVDDNPSITASDLGKCLGMHPGRAQTVLNTVVTLRMEKQIRLKEMKNERS